jgi:hypothetical protein
MAMDQSRKVMRVAEASALGAVDAYMLARLVPSPGQQITCSTPFDDYRAWCIREGFAPLREPQFVEQFESLAREIGIVPRQRGGNLSFLDTALADRPA